MVPLLWHRGFKNCRCGEIVTTRAILMVRTKRIPEHFPAFRRLFPKNQEFALVKQYSFRIDRLPQALFGNVPGPVTIDSRRDELAVPQSIAVICGSEEFRSPSTTADRRSIGAHDTGICCVTV